MAEHSVSSTNNQPLVGAALGAWCEAAPDLQVTAPQFLGALFGGSWPEAWLCGFPDFAHQMWAGAPAGKCREIVGGLRADWNLYFSIALLKPGSSHRSLANFQQCQVLVLDDVGPGGKVPWDAVKLPAHYVIETSPGSYHVGFKLKGATDPNAITALYRALARRNATDAGGATAVHYVRLPNSTNNNPKHAKPFRVRLKLLSMWGTN